MALPPLKIVRQFGFGPDDFERERLRLIEQQRLMRALAPLMQPRPPQPVAKKQRDLHGMTADRVRERFIIALKNGPPEGGRWKSLNAACHYLFEDWGPKNGLVDTYASADSLRRALKPAWESQVPRRRKPR
jgi:hypothetical protein